MCATEEREGANRLLCPTRNPRERREKRKMYAGLVISLFRTASAMTIAKEESRLAKIIM
jgi:hypothetical protein